jgi:hypothetical protein
LVTTDEEIDQSEVDKIMEDADTDGTDTIMFDGFLLVAYLDKKDYFLEFLPKQEVALRREEEYK